MSNNRIRTERGQRSPSVFILLILFTFIFVLWFTMRDASHLAGGNPDTDAETYLKYSTVTGYFMQDDPETDPDTFDFKKSNFGLITQSYDTDSSFPISTANPTQWQRFTHKLTTLNAEAPPSMSFKLLFLGRHGQGDHNVAEAFYGSKAWDCKYSLLPGNGTTTWFDAHLTKLGESQALNANAAWKTHAPPTPQLFFTSPLDRAIHTAALTFSGLFDEGVEVEIEIKESIRETIGQHTCDERSSRTAILARWAHPSPPLPSTVGFHVEPTFSEHDALFSPSLRESDSALTVRARSLLDDIFSSKEGTRKETQVLSLTSHGGWIGGALRAVGHRAFGLRTGGVIPVLVRVERVKGRRGREVVDPWTGLPGEEECEGVVQ